MAKEYLKLGYYISFAGPLTFRKAPKLQETCLLVPKDRLLIETDCPYLTPAPKRGMRNEPSFVVYTGRKIAEELQVDEEEFKKQLNENYLRLFRL